jgi:hypothetical protein
LTVSPPNPAPSVSVTVNSVPQGALLRVDGKEMGTTPKIVEVSIGKHILEFSEEGFNSREVSAGNYLARCFGRQCQL